MAYAVGGLLFLLGIVGYAAVETWRELLHDQQQIAQAEKGSGIDRPGL
jgi:hypothetical protein